MMVGKPKYSMKCDQQSSTLNDAQINKAPKLKKKVQMNTTVQFMGDDDSYELVKIGSPDLNGLDSDDDYIGNLDSEQSDGGSDEADNSRTDDDESDYVDKDDDSSDDNEEDMELDADDFGPLQYRDPNDKEFLLGFELRHFELDTDSGLDSINLRLEETTHEDTSLNDNLAFGLINALLNSSDKADKRKGKQLLKKLKGNAPKKESKTGNKKKAANKSGKSIKMGPNKLKKSSRKAMRTKNAEQSEKLKHIITSTVKHMNMNE